MFLRGDSHAWNEEAERGAIGTQGRNTLPRTEKQRERDRTINRKRPEDFELHSHRQWQNNNITSLKQINVEVSILCFQLLLKGFFKGNF